MKVLSRLILAFFCTQSIYADKEVSLNLRAVVDPELNIERIDDSGTIDLFERVPSNYRIISNSGQSVEVTVTTDNNWVVKTQDRQNSIAYAAEFKGQDGHSGRLDADNPKIKIEKERLQDSKRYEFSLLFKAKESIEDFPAGTYSDRIHVTVTSAQ